MSNKIHILEYLDKSKDVLINCMTDVDLIASIEAAALIISEALANGKKILCCGNGGSFCDAAHFASELIGKYKDVRDPLPAIALGDGAVMTCVSNDFGYPFVFSRQVNGLGNRGDVLLAITTSGTSENVLNAVFEAKEKRMKVIVLTGKGGSTSYADVEVRVPSRETALIQQCHTAVIHILVELIEQNL